MPVAFIILFLYLAIVLLISWAEREKKEVSLVDLALLLLFFMIAGFAWYFQLTDDANRGLKKENYEKERTILQLQEELKELRRENYELGQQIENLKNENTLLTRKYQEEKNNSEKCNKRYENLKNQQQELAEALQKYQEYLQQLESQLTLQTKE
jgi:DNA repair exonuclease SbcCD ATPase subunit